MAKFNIEVELDWMEEEAYSIDDELRKRIVKGVENTLLEKATNEAVKAVDNKIAEKILEAEGTIQATVDQFIANVCEEKIGKIVIPEKKSTWSDEVTYKSLSEYVGERFELFLTEKRYDRDGHIASYTSDRKLSAADLLTSQYLEEELGKKVEKLIANAKREVEESLIETIEGNKPFEIRKNDRDFQVGDVLILKEWDNIKYSGREIGAVVRYVLIDFIGLQEGYVALGLQILD